MCPDRQILSLYFDSELPSPWKEKMEAHLETCVECRAALARYGKIGDCFRDLPEKTVEAAQDRVWEKLSARGFPEAPERVPVKRNIPVRQILYRRITLPLPAAAAAVLVVVAFFTFVGIRGLKSPSPQNTVAAVVPDYVQNIPAAMPDYMQLFGDDQGFPSQDMAGVLQYLSSQDYGDFMVIRLPESRTFSRIGEPALINAADYPRRNASR